MPSKKMLKDAELSEESVLDSFDSDGGNYGCSTNM